MDKMPSLSPKERIILDLLISKGEMYGLEMVNAEPKKLKRGAIYVMLSRLDEKGFVTSRLIDDEVLPGKKRPRYSITGLGQRALRAQEAAEQIFRGGEALA